MLVSEKLVNNTAVEIIFMLCAHCATILYLYLMNFMFDTTFDAVGNILRVPYKIRKSDVSFSRGSVSTLFRWGEHVRNVCKKCHSCLQQCKNYKNQTSFCRVMITNVLPHFLWITVYTGLLRSACLSLPTYGAQFWERPPSPASQRPAARADPAQPAVRTMSSYRGMDASL